MLPLDAGVLGFAAAGCAANNLSELWVSFGDAALLAGPVARPVRVPRLPFDVRVAIMSRLPRVYMAGKVAKQDWRHDLVGPYLRNVELRYDRAENLVHPMSAYAIDGLEYAGPFFLADDHGCFHGPHSHGFGALHWPDCAVGDVSDEVARASERIYGNGGEWAKTREIIHRSCLNWLQSSDVVFAWVESWDAYGTLVELGYARALGIPIYLCFDLMYRQDVHPDSPSSVWNDWWFAEQTATTRDMLGDVSTAWESFVGWWHSGMQGYWALRRAGFEEGRPWCPTHRPLSSKSH